MPIRVAHYTSSTDEMYRREFGGWGARIPYAMEDFGKTMLEEVNRKHDIELVVGMHILNCVRGTWPDGEPILRVREVGLLVLQETSKWVDEK